MPQKGNSSFLICILAFIPVSQGMRVTASLRASRDCDGKRVGDRQIILVRHQRIDKKTIKEGVIQLTEHSAFHADVVGRKLAGYIALKMIKSSDSAANVSRPTLFYFLQKPPQELGKLQEGKKTAQEWQIDETARVLVNGFDEVVDIIKDADFKGASGMKKIRRGRSVLNSRQLTAEDLNEQLSALVVKGWDNYTSEVSRGTGDIVVVASQEYIADFLTKQVFGDEDGLVYLRKFTQQFSNYTFGEVVGGLKEAKAGPGSLGDWMYSNAFVLSCVDGLWIIAAFPYV